MAALDHVRSLADIVVPTAAANDGVRQPTTAENNKRTERFNVKVTAQVDITVAGTGILNRGSILACVDELVFSDGGEVIHNLDARLARQIGEILAPSTLPATRLAGAGVQAATILTETVPILLSAYRTGNPNETKYVEANKQLSLLVAITPKRLITRLAEGGALAGTVTAMTAKVEQVFDELTNAPPFLQPYISQQTVNVTAANPQLKVDLRGSRYMRGIMIQQDSDFGEVSDIINALVLRGDKGSFIGDRAISFADLVQAQAYEFGGAIPAGYLWIDFARYGRLSAMWEPYQDTNLRLELDVSVSARANGKVRVATVEYQRTKSTTSPVPFKI